MVTTRGQSSSTPNTEHPSPKASAQTTAQPRGKKPKSKRKKKGTSKRKLNTANDVAQARPRRRHRGSNGGAGPSSPQQEIASLSQHTDGMTPSQTETHGTPNANQGTPSTPHPSVSATTPSPTQVGQQSRTINDVTLEVNAISSALATALNRQNQQHVLAMESQTALTRQIKEMTERSKAETSALHKRLDESLHHVSGAIAHLKNGMVNRAEVETARVSAELQKLRSELTDNLNEAISKLPLSTPTNTPPDSSILTPPSSTSRERLEGILKAKRTGNPIHTKAEKEAMASFKNVLTDVLGKEIPIDLARAIFRLDLFNVMKYCPILDDGLQDKYDELLNERSAQRESTMKALTLAILADSQATVYDDTAENLVANETNNWLQYSQNVFLHGTWILEHVWSTFLPELASTIKDFFIKLRPKVQGTPFEIVLATLRKTFTSIHRESERAFRDSFTTGVKWVNELQTILMPRFEDYFRRKQIETLNMRLWSPTPSPQPKPTPKTGAKEKTKPVAREKDPNRDQVALAIGKELGSEFKFNSGSMRKLCFHKDAKTGKDACLFAGAGKWCGFDDTCKVEGCTRSHDFKACYPHGLKCITGKCEASCPSRK